MNIEDIVWLDDVVDKIETKHKITIHEVEEVFYNKPKYKKAQKGKYEGRIYATPMVEQKMVVTY